MTDLNAENWPSLGGRWTGDRHVMPVRVYFEDTDFSGIVYHASYLRFLERGRSEFLRQTGVDHADMIKLDGGLAFAVRRMALSFEKTATIDDVLEVETWIDEMRGATMKMGQRVMKDGVPVVSAEVQAVVIGQDGKPRRIPDILRERFRTAQS